MKITSFVYKRQSLIPILALVWVVAAVIVNPIGDFPLNDDFSFGRTVYNLSERGILEFDDWLSMTLITQVLWGASFCKLFGFSFTVLRFSTLILGYFGVIACWLMVRALGLRGFFPALVALVIAFNPLYFSLSYTFMSDVPFFSLLCLSILFYVKFFKSEKFKWFLWANVFALATIFIRQLGLLLPLTFAFTWLFAKKINSRNIALAILPLVIFLFFYLLYLKWFETTQGTPETFGTFPKLFKRLGQDNFWKVCLDRVGLLLIYMGLFFLPFNLLIFNWPKRRAVVIVVFGAIIFGIVCMFGIWQKFPYGNILYNLGLGPKALKDGIFFLNVEPQLPIGVVRAIALTGIFGAILLIINVVNAFFDKEEKEPFLKTAKLFSTVAIVIYGGFLMLDVHFFDRYFLPLFPFGIILLSSINTPNLGGNFKVLPKFSRSIVLSTFALLLLTTFSISATHDYISWNRARWKALDLLTNEMSKSPNQIDGGFEFNGWHRPVKERTFGAYKSWWWVDEDDYVISFGDLGGFHKMDTFLFNTYLPPATDTIFILKKN